MNVSRKGIKSWQDIASLPLWERASRGMCVGFIYGTLLSLPMALLVLISGGALTKALLIILLCAAFLSLVLVVLYVFKILSIPNSYLRGHAMLMVVILCIAAIAWGLEVLGAYVS